MKVVPEYEMIRVDEISQALTRVERADERYRFAIDMASLTAE